ncbi:MAG: glycosyltransferase [Nitrosomonas sp.]|nr:glycosyltransferase [Nitrosomonas sp.]
MKNSSMTTHSSICAVVVTYHPDLVELENLLLALTKQVTVTVIVDNGSSKDSVNWIEAHQQENIVFLSLSDNFGVAEAHNHAIRWAQKTTSPMWCFSIRTASLFPI